MFQVLQQGQLCSGRVDKNLILETVHRVVQRLERTEGRIHERVHHEIREECRLATYARRRLGNALIELLVGRLRLQMDRHQETRRYVEMMLSKCNMVLCETNHEDDGEHVP